jgi:hypothetical protein
VSKFKPGASGNPKGRPKGSRNKVTVELDALAEQTAPYVLKAALKAAISGDVAAQKLILERLWPARKGRPVRIKLPTIETAADAAAGIDRVIAAIAEGELSPEEGAALAGILERRIQHFDLLEHEVRLAKLEREKEQP